MSGSGRTGAGSNAGPLHRPLLSALSLPSWPVQLGIRYTITTLNKLPPLKTIDGEHFREKVSRRCEQLPCLTVWPSLPGAAASTEHSAPEVRQAGQELRLHVQQLVADGAQRHRSGPVQGRAGSRAGCRTRSRMVCATSKFSQSACASPLMPPPATAPLPPTGSTPPPTPPSTHPPSTSLHPLHLSHQVWLKFPREGSGVTPPHPSADFKWKDYCPTAFK